MSLLGTAEKRLGLSGVAGSIAMMFGNVGTGKEQTFLGIVGVGMWAWDHLKTIGNAFKSGQQNSAIASKAPSFFEQKAAAALDELLGKQVASHTAAVNPTQSTTPGA